MPAETPCKIIWVFAGNYFLDVIKTRMLGSINLCSFNASLILVTDMKGLLTMHTLTFFNHKGGVGKTTLTVNVADVLVDLGLRVLMVDADPQCNLTSFFLDENVLDNLLGQSDDVNGGTLWSAIKPVVDGKGPIKEVNAFMVRDGLYLCPGDVLLADYEEELPSA